MDEKNECTVTSELLTNKEKAVKSKDHPSSKVFKIIIGVLTALVISLVVALIFSLATNVFLSSTLSKSSASDPTSPSSIISTEVTSKAAKNEIGHEIKPKLDSIWNNFQLPSFFKPSYYTLDLRIDVDLKQFVGNCSIIFKCFQDNTFLVLHADPNLKLTGENKFPVINQIDEFSHNTTGQLTVDKIEINEFYSYIILVLKKGHTFKKDLSYSVNFVNYHSEITNNLKGIYYSTYMSNDEKKTLVVSQLQPLDARAVFPSFDEPSLKARFRISITHRKSILI